MGGGQSRSGPLVGEQNLLLENCTQELPAPILVTIRAELPSLPTKICMIFKCVFFDKMNKIDTVGVVTGLVDFIITGCLLSFMEYCRTRLAVYIHLQRLQWDSDTRKTLLSGSICIYYFSHFPWVRSCHFFPIFLSYVVHGIRRTFRCVVLDNLDDYLSS
jgi:hypothetical protein